LADPYAVYKRMREEAPVLWDRRFGWLVFPLQFDGVALPLRRCALHLARPGARDGRLRIGSRVRRVARVAARVAFSGGRFHARTDDGG